MSTLAYIVAGVLVVLACVVLTAGMVVYALAVLALGVGIANTAMILQRDADEQRGPQ